MQVRFILFADAANISREGKLNITGEFNTIYAQKVPTAWPSMSIVVRLEAPIAAGAAHTFQLRLTNADGLKLNETPHIPISFVSAGSGVPARSDVLVNLVGAVFPVYGDYSISVIVDGVHHESATLFVRQLSQEPSAGTKDG